MKVLIADAVAQSCVDILEQAGFEVDNRPGLGDEDKLQALAPCTGLVVRSATQVSAAMMDAAPQLRVIGRAGSGVDNIDVAAATERGILVMNAPGENTLSAAEHAFAMLMAVSRNIPAADARMHDGAWGKSGLMGVELVDKTIGVLGLGRIGQAVATRARAFGMRVLGYDPFLPAEVAASLGVELCELDDIWPRADFLTIHTPLTDKTRHIVDAPALAACKPGIRVVNCARGGLLDESALLDALASGHAAGAALDVFEQEPLPADSPLRADPRVVLTPHLGASTSEAQEKVAVRIAEQFIAYLQQGEIRNAVNSFSVDGPTAARLAPWLTGAQALGRMQAALLDGACKEIEITVAGELTELPTDSITASVLCGFLAPQLSRQVNVVNAASVARQQGYRVSESTDQQSEGFASLVRVRVVGENATHEVAGSVVGRGRAKLVRIDRFRVEAELKDHMLICRNSDVPGRLAAITGVIAEQGVNLANCSVGRDVDAQQAMNAIELDAALSDAGLAALRAVDGVEGVHQVRL